MSDFKKQIEELMLKNRRIHGNFQYTVPSPDTYPYQWLWDSCFNAIILCEFNTEDAKKELLSLVSKQFENGMVPHMVYWDGVDHSPAFHNKRLSKIKWGKADTSTITQPPMIAFASLKIYKTDGDKDFLKKIYPHLENFCRYLLGERDPRGHNLAGIINPDESGEDNSPRFDDALGLPPKHTRDENFKRRLELVIANQRCKFDAPNCMRNFFWMKDVPFNAILIENLRCTAEIAKALEKDEDATFFTKRAKLIEKAMRKFMFERGIFWSTQGPNYERIKIVTWAIFAPLFAEILTKEEAEKLVKTHLLNRSKFNLPFAVPTVSKSEPSFDPEGFWRGSTWIGTNWFLFHGLKKYGFKKEAKKVLDSSVALLEKSGFREYFNPLTGEGLGAHDFTWGGLILDME